MHGENCHLPPSIMKPMFVDDSLSNSWFWKDKQDGIYIASSGYKWLLSKTHT